MIELSVAIPMFRAEHIGWLIMESLCRQTHVDFEWELVVAEELFDGAFGKERIFGYRNRLEEVGCVKINYIGLEKWIPLSDKYVRMAKECSETSGIYASDAADIYMPPKRLKTSYDIFKDNPAVGFCAGAKTIFYDIMTEKTFIYDVALRSRQNDGANRTFRMEIMKKLPLAGKRKSVDSFTWAFANKYVTSTGKKFTNVLDTSDNWKYGLNVHGLNNISLKRGKLFNKPESGVCKNTVDISKTIPADILDRLRLCKRYVATHGAKPKGGK